MVFPRLCFHPKMSFMIITPFIFIFFISPFSSTSLTFNYTSFNGNPNITCERAYIRGDGVIQLTSDGKASIGRATYTEPMQLWDNSTGKLADFTTYFSFIIDSQNRTSYGDGIAFFLAPVGSTIPANLTKGGPLGLTTVEQVFNSTENPFVAVEFDVFKNPWDPPGTHVGIDINSMVSVQNISWMSDIREGKTNEAWIRYDSMAKNLSVVFTGFGNDSAETKFLQSLSSVVDFTTLLPQKVVFGFSASTGNVSAAHIVTAWNFSSSIDIPPLPTPSSESGTGNKIGLVVGLCVGGVVVVVGLVTVVIWFFLCRRNRNRYDDDDDNDEEDEVLNYMNSELQMGSSVPKNFSYSELAKSTNYFKSENKLGEGGFGGVYKGFLKSTNCYVAVKKISRASKQGVKEYASEVNIISRLRHRNLVQLLGWCHEKPKELLLVYEFMPNGSLDCHLFQGKSLIPWEVRYKIARGLASALLYLHEEWEQLVVHRDIKSSNIMLDSEFNVKLGDFGLARFVDHGKGAQTTVLAGTMGYMAPECASTFRASKETDVYSFGVVCLELACGRKPIIPTLPENQIVLVEWIKELHSHGQILRAADPILCGDFNEEQMERLMMVGLACTLMDSGLRPSVRQAIQVLDFSSPVPLIPVKIKEYDAQNHEYSNRDSRSTTESTNLTQFTKSDVSISSSGLQISR